MAATPGATTTTTAHDRNFIAQLVRFLGSLKERFPENQGFVMAHAFAGTAAQSDAMSASMRDGWAEFTLKLLDPIMNEEHEPLLAAVQTSTNPVLRAMDLSVVFTLPGIEAESKRNAWGCMKVLTLIAHHGRDSQAAAELALRNSKIPTAEKQEAEKRAEETATPPKTESSAKTPPNKVDIKQAMSSMIEMMPKFMETFNEMMKDDDGTNVFAQVAKQFLDPKQARPGFANNVMGNYMEPATSKMEEVQEQILGMSAEQIAARLKKLERIEAKARANRLRRRNAGEAKAGEHAET